jgi:hypothetical protein
LPLLLCCLLLELCDGQFRMQEWQSRDLYSVWA